MSISETISNKEASRRGFLSLAAAVTGGLVLTTTSQGIAHAVNEMYGREIKTTELYALQKITGRLKNVYTSFHLSSANGLRYLTYEGKNYLLAVSTANGKKAFSCYDAHTGDLLFTGDTPGVASGNLVYDGSRFAYFSAKNVLMKVDMRDRKVTQLKKANAGVNNYMNLALDYKKRLWATTYPYGGLVRIDTNTGAELFRTNKVGNGNTYTKGLDVSPNGKTLYFGTGTNDPNLWSMNVDSPNRFTKLPIPDNNPNYIVAQVIAVGRKVMVWHQNSANRETCKMYDTLTKKWITVNHPPSNRVVTKPYLDGYCYYMDFRERKLVRFNPNQADITITSVSGIHPEITASSGVFIVKGMVYVAQDKNNKLTARLATINGRHEKLVHYKVERMPAPIQSMAIHPQTNRAYIGGYREKNMQVVNLLTDKRWDSAPGADIHQIEGLHADGSKLYIGSYGHSKIVRHDVGKDPSDRLAYKNLGGFYERYKQDRPFGWASTANYIVFGTVPFYGHNTGALGIIHRGTEHISMITQPFHGLSVISLGGEPTSNIVYGGTSILTGYGAEQVKTSADIFAYDVHSKKEIWRTTLPGAKDIYGPVVRGNKLYFATVNSIIEVDKATGKALGTVTIRNWNANPGWKNVKIMELPYAKGNLVHFGAGQIHVFNVDTKEKTRVLPNTYFRSLGSFDRYGNLWGNEGDDIIKIYIMPKPKKI